MNCPKCHVEVGTRDKKCWKCGFCLSEIDSPEKQTEYVPGITLSKQDDCCIDIEDHGGRTTSGLGSHWIPNGGLERPSPRRTEPPYVGGTERPYTRGTERSEEDTTKCPINSSYSSSGAELLSAIDDKINGNIAKGLEHLDGGMYRGHADDYKDGRYESNGLSQQDKSLETAYVINEIPKEGTSACNCLRIEYNYNRFSIEGAQNNLQFRLTPLAENQRGDIGFRLRQVRIFCWIVKNIDKEDYREVSMLNNLKLTENNTIDFTITINEKAGFYTLVFRVECITDDGKSYYMFQQRDHLVYEKEQPSTPSAPINVYASGQHAADVRVNVEAIKYKSRTTNDFLQMLNTLPPAFGVKQLYECNSEEVPNNSLNKEERLLLQINGYSLFIIGKTTVKLGRDKSLNDLQVRIPGLPLWERPNRAVSSMHGVLSIIGNVLTYKDTSTYGTKLNGGEWIPGGCWTLPINCQSILEFGNIPLVFNPSSCIRKEDDEICMCCNLPQGCICSVALRRQDNVPESYLIVPYCCDLGKVLPELAGWILYRRNGCFGIRTPDGESHPLRIGGKITFAGLNMIVDEFKQV